MQVTITIKGKKPFVVSIPVNVTEQVDWQELGRAANIGVAKDICNTIAFGISEELHQEQKAKFIEQ